MIPLEATTAIRAAIIKCYEYLKSPPQSFRIRETGSTKSYEIIINDNDEWYYSFTLVTTTSREYKRMGTALPAYTERDGLMGLPLAVMNQLPTYLDTFGITHGCLSELIAVDTMYEAFPHPRNLKLASLGV